MLHGEVLPSGRMEAGPSGGVHLSDGENVLMWLPAVTMTTKKCRSADAFRSVRLCENTECVTDICTVSFLSADSSASLQEDLHLMIGKTYKHGQRGHERELDHLTPRNLKQTSK